MNSSTIILEKLTEESFLTIDSSLEYNKYFYTLQEEFLFSDKLPNIILRVIGKDKKEVAEKFMELLKSDKVKQRIESRKNKGAWLNAIYEILE